MRFDVTMPYAEVCGVPGVSYEQNGVFYTVAGHEVRDGVVVLAPDEPADAGPTSEFRGMHWKQLKALVESYGEDWTNKDNAVAFLERGAVESEAA